MSDSLSDDFGTSRQQHFWVVCFLCDVGHPEIGVHVASDGRDEDQEQGKTFFSGGPPAISVP